jgi:hypothetical protein
MTIQASTLRPGLLVSLKTSVVGNVRYAKVVLDADKEVDGGALVARWETERTISDPKEHEEAIKVRGKARNAVIAVCAQSAFGLLCPEDKASLLDKAVAEARALADEFNSRARLTRIHIYVIAGRIAPDDAEAVRALNNEITGLMDSMERGLRNLDVRTVREAAARARNVGQMLSPAAQERVAIAVEAARSAARKIIQAGETGAREIDQVALNAIATSRTAFLDLDDSLTIAVPAAEGRAVDFEPLPVTPTAMAHTAPQIEVN